MSNTQLPCECLHGVSWVLRNVSTKPPISTLLPSTPLLYKTLPGNKNSVMSPGARVRASPTTGSGWHAAEFCGLHSVLGQAEQISSLAGDLDDIFLLPFFFFFFYQIMVHCMQCHILFTHSSHDGHLGCLHFLAIMYESLCGPMFSFLLGRYVGVKWLSHMATLFILLRESSCFPQQLHSFTFPPITSHTYF